VLSAGLTAATEEALSQPEIPSATVQGVALYADLKRRAPALLDKMVSDQEDRFYDLVLAIQGDPDIGSTEPDSLKRAALAAHQIMQNPAVQTADVDAQVREAAVNLSKSGWGETKNPGILSAMMMRQVRLYVQSGLSPTLAVDRAKEFVSERLVKINGWHVPAKSLPIEPSMRAEFPDILTGYVNEWAEKNAEGLGLDADDITVRYNPATDAWTLVDGSTGLPVSNDTIPTTALVDRFATQRAERERARRQAELNMLMQEKFRDPRSPEVGWVGPLPVVEPARPGSGGR